MISGTQVFFWFSWMEVSRPFEVIALFSRSQFIKEERLSVRCCYLLSSATFSAQPRQAAGELSSEQHTCNTTKRHVGETLWQLMCSWGRWIYINNSVDLNQITSTALQLTRIEIFIFCPKIQLWFHEKNCLFFWVKNSWKSSGNWTL